MPKYRLKLSKLDFCSLVDDPAQPNAKTLLIKRKGKRDEIEATARLAKLNEDLGLAFFWAFTSTNPDGTDHFDLHGDTIDADFVKAAMDFMLDGGAVDEMHDGEPTGARVAFAMPMTPEIASAYGVTTKQYGLMIAIKPTDEQLAKLKDGSYTGVSIAGWGTREPIAARKGRVCKASLYTDVVDGHQHQICIWDNGEMYVQSATSEGADMSHSHGIVRNAEGAIEILLDSGHTHQIAEGQPSVIIVEPETIVVVQARKSLAGARGQLEAAIARHERHMAGTEPTDETSQQRMMDEMKAALAEMSDEDVTGGMPMGKRRASKSTPPIAPRSVKSQGKETPVDPKDQQIADLTKRAERAERIAKMSGAQKAHFDTLATEDAEAFLAKSSAERDAEIAKAVADDPVEVEFNGRQYRKSMGAEVIELAKAAKAQAEQIEKAEIEKATTETCGQLAGSDELRQVLIGLARKHAKAAELLAMIKSWASETRVGKTAAGANPGADPELAPQVEWDAAIESLMKDKNLGRPAATEELLKTAKGVQLYAAVTKRK